MKAWPIQMTQCISCQNLDSTSSRRRVASYPAPNCLYILSLLVTKNREICLTKSNKREWERKRESQKWRVEKGKITRLGLISHSRKFARFIPSPFLFLCSLVLYLFFLTPLSLYAPQAPLFNSRSERAFL